MCMSGVYSRTLLQIAIPQFNQQVTEIYIYRRLQQIVDQITIILHL